MSKLYALQLAADDGNLLQRYAFDADIRQGLASGTLHRLLNVSGNRSDFITDAQKVNQALVAPHFDERRGSRIPSVQNLCEF